MNPIIKIRGTKHRSEAQRKSCITRLRGIGCHPQCHTSPLLLSSARHSKQTTNAIVERMAIKKFIFHSLSVNLSFRLKATQTLLDMSCVANREYSSRIMNVTFAVEYTPKSQIWIVFVLYFKTVYHIRSIQISALVMQGWEDMQCLRTYTTRRCLLLPSLVS